MPDATTGPAAVPRRRRGEPTSYDFRRPAKLSRDHVRRLEHAGETFARQWTTLLTGAVRGAVSVVLDGVLQQTYDEWVGALDPPVVLLPFAPRPLAGTAVLALRSGTALEWVDQLLGGGGGASQPHRLLTEIEQELVLDLARRSLGEMTYAFEPVTHVQPTDVALEQNPQFVQAAAATDVVVVLAFSIVLSGVTHPASILLPLGPLVSVMDATAVTSEQSLARARTLAQVQAGMGEVPVQVGARLRGTRLTPSRLVALRPGDLLRLDHRADEPLQLVTADVVVGHAVSGSRGPRLACLVVDKEDR